MGFSIPPTEGDQLTPPRLQLLHAQICVANAVKATDWVTGDKITDAVEGRVLENQSASQIVTYSLRRVEKLSDVSDSMNISGSLGI